MKLLEPNRLQEIKNKERLVEMQSGAFLAKKVDDLRTKIADEESKLEVIVNKTIPFYRAVISELLADKNALELECSSLAQQKLVLLEPVNARADELDNKEAQLAILESELLSKQSLLSSVKKKQDTQEHQLKILETKLENRKEQYKQLITEVSNLKKEYGNKVEIQRIEDIRLVEEWNKISNAKRELEEIREGNERIAAENKKESNILKVERRKLNAQRLMYDNRSKQ